MKMTRCTQDGSFDAQFVEHGFQVAAYPAEKPFEAEYTLTKLGREAVEGLEVEVVVNQLPLRAMEQLSRYSSYWSLFVCMKISPVHRSAARKTEKRFFDVSHQMLRGARNATTER